LPAADALRFLHNDTFAIVTTYGRRAFNDSAQSGRIARPGQPRGETAMDNLKTMARAGRAGCLAIALALVASVAALPTAPASAQTVEVLEGRLGVIWGDPRPGQIGGGTVLFELYRDDGTSVPLTVAPAQQNEAIGAFGKRIRVRGVSSSNQGGRPSIETQSIELLEREDRSGLAPQAVTTRRMLNILVRYAGDTQQPHPARFFNALSNPKKPNANLGIPATINGFYDKTSWGQFQWDGDVVGQGGHNPTVWLTLPKTKAQYAPCGWSGSCAGSNLSTLFDDAVALAAAQPGVNMSVYDNINLMLNNDLDCCAWGGSRFYNGKQVGVTWNPPWAQRAGIFVHELGHSLGLPHSGWVYFAYDSNWDQMSRGTVASQTQCGTYISANNSNASTNLFCDEPGSGFIAAYKDHLGWIPDANKVVIDSVSNTRVVIEANALKLGAGIKMVKICLQGFNCTGSTARYITVEARIRTGEYEETLPNEGVVIHDVQRNRAPIGGGNACFFNTQSGWAVPIDSTPGDYNGAPTCAGTAGYPNWGLHNAQFNVGDTYTNNQLGVRVRVLNRNGNKFVVRVERTK
jgi:M6 family metalloprotease-like protein